MAREPEIIETYGEELPDGLYGKRIESVSRSEAKAGPKRAVFQRFRLTGGMEIYHRPLNQRESAQAFRSLTGAIGKLRADLNEHLSAMTGSSAKSTRRAAKREEIDHIVRKIEIFQETRRDFGVTRKQAALYLERDVNTVDRLRQEGLLTELPKQRRGVWVSIASLLDYKPLPKTAAKKA